MWIKGKIKEQVRNENFQQKNYIYHRFESKTERDAQLLLTSIIQNKTLQRSLTIYCFHAYILFARRT